MWVEIIPRRPDFCGLPPCTLCYRWADDAGVTMTGLERMSLELTGKRLDELAPSEKVQLQKAADRIHKGALMPNVPTLEPPPEADIGMSVCRQIDGWLAEHKAPAAPIRPTVLTLDQRDDWQKPIEESVKREKLMAERLQMMRQLMYNSPIYDDWNNSPYKR